MFPTEGEIQSRLRKLRSFRRRQLLRYYYVYSTVGCWNTGKKLNDRLLLNLDLTTTCDRLPDLFSHTSSQQSSSASASRAVNTRTKTSFFFFIFYLHVTVRGVIRGRALFPTSRVFRYKVSSRADTRSSRPAARLRCHELAPIEAPAKR